MKSAIAIVEFIINHWLTLSTIIVFVFGSGFWYLKNKNIREVEGLEIQNEGSISINIEKNLMIYQKLIDDLERRMNTIRKESQEEIERIKREAAESEERYKSKIQKLMTEIQNLKRLLNE